MYLGPHVKYPLLLVDFNETWIFVADLRKMLKYIFLNASSRSLVVPCGRTGRYDEANNRFSKFMGAENGIRYKT